MESQLITVASFIEPSMAYLAKSRLEYEGIECWITDEYLINMKWTLSLALGGVKLSVQLKDKDDAVKILESDLSKELESIEELYKDNDEEQCSECGSQNLQLVNWSRKAAALSLLLGFPFLFFRKRLICTNCGHSMKIKKT